MKCPNCDTINPDNARFCRNCGMDLQENDIPDEEVALEIITNAVNRLKIRIIDWDKSKCENHLCLRGPSSRLNLAGYFCKLPVLTSASLNQSIPFGSYCDVKIGASGYSWCSLNNTFSAPPTLVSQSQTKATFMRPPNNVLSFCPLTFKHYRYCFKKYR